MIDFAPEQRRSGPVVNGWEPGGLNVSGRLYARSLILTPVAVFDWPPATIEQLQPSHLESLLDQTADVYLLGTGHRQRFPDLSILAPLLRRGIAIEVMDSGATCRTFNVLSTEGRRAVAGIILEA